MVVQELRTFVNPLDGSSILVYQQKGENIH
jgi:hypothetical protein